MKPEQFGPLFELYQKRVLPKVAPRNISPPHEPVDVPNALEEILPWVNQVTAPTVTVVFPLAGTVAAGGSATG